MKNLKHVAIEIVICGSIEPAQIENIALNSHPQQSHQISKHKYEIVELADYNNKIALAPQKSSLTEFSRSIGMIVMF